MKKNLTFILASLAISLSFAQDQGQLQAIDSIVNSKLSDNDPGLFVGVVHNGEIIYEKYKGLASLEHQVKVNETSRSNIASTAKQFVALMVLDLSMKDKLSLEDDIRKYLPRLYPDVKEEIKVRHLLNHTSGIRDYCDLMGLQQNAWWRREGLDNEDVIEFLGKQEDLAFEPGSKYVYSNSAYILLTKIVEEVVKEGFHTYSKSFFTKLGMPNTSFVEDYMYVIPNQAQPYSDWGDGIWQQYHMITSLYGDGFLFTTLKDQLTYEKALQKAKKNNNQLLLASQQSIPNSEITTYGFGLELGEWLNYPAIHHAGGTVSYGSQVIRFPDEGLTVFVMSNNGKIWSGGIATEVADVILPKREKTIEYDAGLSSFSGKLKESDILGSYISSKGYLRRIVKEEGQIIWKSLTGRPLKLEKEGKALYHFVLDNSYKIAFTKDTMFMYQPTREVTAYTRTVEEKITLADSNSFEGDYLNEELAISFSLKLKKGKLLAQVEGSKELGEVNVATKNQLLMNDYFLDVERDIFNRVVGVRLTNNRAENIKFIKKTNLRFQPEIETDKGSIQVTTIGSHTGESSQILLTANYPNGNEIWSKQFGGSSYDKANSIISVNDGYLIIGSTSSYGNGNYDILVIKTNKKGKQQWQKTYGNFYNEYGYMAEKTDSGYLIKGTIQECTGESEDILEQSCVTKVWMITTDDKGNEISNVVLEKVVD